MKLNYELVFGPDKIGHFILFFILSFLLGMIIVLLIDQYFVKNSFLIMWLFLVLLGIGEEYRQFHMVDRSAEFVDAVANTLGVSCGLLLPYLLARKNKNKSVVHLMLFCALLPLPFFAGLLLINEVPFYFYE